MQTEDGTSGTFEAYAPPIGPSFDFGSTKSTPIVVGASIGSCEPCEYTCDILRLDGALTPYYTGN
jgi:hypothetical protein